MEDTPILVLGIALIGVGAILHIAGLGWDAFAIVLALTGIVVAIQGWRIRQHPAEIRDVQAVRRLDQLAVDAIHSRR